MGGRSKNKSGRKAIVKRASSSLPAIERRLIRDIQQALSVDLLAPAYRNFAEPEDHYVKGHCYIATEAFYYLYGNAAGYKACFTPTGRSVTHWWLMHPADGRIADPTAPQVAVDFDYSKGSRKGFLNTSPNKRTRELMRRVRARQAKEY